MKNKIALLFLAIFFINFCSAYTIYVRPLDSGSLQPSTSFNYVFNFSRNIFCTDIVLSNSSSITTDRYGIGFIDIDISSIPDTPSYVCEYKDGSLRKVHEISDQIFDNIFSQTINAVTGYFTDIGSSISKVVNGWFENIWADNINATIINSSIIYQDGNRVLDESNNGSYLSTYNATYASASKATFINYTNIKTTGNISNGSLVGYAAGTAICNSEISGSHMCTMDEVLEAQNNNEYSNFTATFRVSEGAPGYLANANDCSGWKDATTSSLGAIWVGNNINGGSGALVSCSAERAIGCCK